MKYLKPIVIILACGALSFAFFRLNARIDVLENSMLFEADVNARVLESDIMIQQAMQKEIEELQQYCLPNSPNQEGDSL